MRAEQSTTAKAIESLTRVSQGTHDTLMGHVEHSRIREEEASAARVKDHEGSTMRSVRIIGIGSGIFIVLIALHAFATGQPVWVALLGMLRGG
jgi:hypothetical protein